MNTDDEYREMEKWAVSNYDKREHGGRKGGSSGKMRTPTYHCHSWSPHPKFDVIEFVSVRL
jgi:hypothetical protein